MIHTPVLLLIYAYVLKLFRVAAQLPALISRPVISLMIWMPFATYAAGVPTLNEVVVTAKSNNLIGSANSANEGTVLKKQLDQRVVYRPGELLESVPGLIVTQHSGEGKANQYFARGFNLDHGTDLRISVDGMLVNQRSHGHGQGYTDLNFLVPELASGLQYQKGPYYADQGDFSSAGAVNIGYLNKLPTGIANFTVGNQGFMRGLVANSRDMGAGTILYAVELNTKDGPWVTKENYKKFNTVLRYSQNTGNTRFNITAMGYGANWNSTDQIPERALSSGLISRLGAIDPSDGGESHRFSLSGALQHTSDYGITKVNLYAIHSNLALFSNFTYFLDDPVNGDQFSQVDKRFQTALNLSHAWVNNIAGFAFENTVGVQVQNDVIDNGLLSTKQRQTLSITRRDHILQNSTGLYYQNSVQWLEKFRSVTGVRSDFYWFDVKSN
ncbi:MAG: TonB-dependent receptor plug domain-containing protein, partial [Nitrosospira sp.]